MNRFLIVLALIFIPSVIHTDRTGVEGIPKISLAELKSLVKSPSPAALQSLKDEGGKISTLLLMVWGISMSKPLKA